MLLYLLRQSLLIAIVNLAFKPRHFATFGVVYMGDSYADSVHGQSNYNTA